MFELSNHVTLPLVIPLEMGCYRRNSTDPRYLVPFPKHQEIWIGYLSVKITTLGETVVHVKMRQTEEDKQSGHQPCVMMVDHLQQIPVTMSW